MRLLWLPKVLRTAGLPVVELDGWDTRGKPTINPQGVVVHHTAAGPHVRDAVVDKLLTVGRPDLAGPLSQLGLRRDGTWVIVAAGRANHNGYGLWGNDSIGVEAYNDGQGEPWPPAQMKSYQAGVAAICRHLGWNTDRVKGHKETDPGRKIDPTFDMAQFRKSVADLIVPPQEAPDMDAHERRLLEELHRFFASPVVDGIQHIPANYHSGADALLTVRHQVGLLPGQVRAAADAAATPAEVAGIVDAALGSLIAALDGLVVDNQPVDAETIRRLLVELLESAA